jgi:hypothetical protein
MTVGPQLSAAQVNAQLSQLSIGLRDACRAAANFQEWAVTTGAAGLEAIGYDSADASTVLNLANYMNTIAAVFFGTAGQASEFDFDNAISQLYGGQ